MSVSTHSDDHGEHHDHVLPISVYLKVYGALLVLTYLTVQVSYWALGSFSLPVAMVVAVIKAGLVVGFFMHLRYDTRFHSLVFFGSLLFLSIFAIFTLFDLTARGAMVEEVDTFTYRQSQQAVSEANRAEARAAAAAEAAAAGDDEAAPEPEGEAPAPEGAHKLVTDKTPEAFIQSLITSP